MTQNTQTVAGQPYLFSYLYNLAGGQTQISYHSGRIVATGYDGAGRPVSVTGALSGASTPYIPSVTSGPPNVQYAAQGAISQINMHNGLSETTGYNARLQPTSIQLGSLLTLGYGYSATNNNGNVGSQTITSALTAGGTMTAQQVYGYDGANRLTSVAETVQSGLPNGVMAGNWSIAHGYDQYGNQWATTGLPMGPAMPTAQTQFNAPLNRLSARSTGAALPADAYDAAGNLQDHPDIGQMTYDAENRQLTYSNGGGQAASYDYDGEGRRVRKTTPAGTTVYVYDAAGELATEMDPAGSVTDTGTLYLTADHLGSTRAVTDASGGLKERWDYFPFGQTIPSGQVFGNRNLVAGYDTATGVTLEFTGKERDAETGLDYFGARYFSSAQGRWTSPDWSATPQPVPYADLDDPQTLNLYAYARNNPMSNRDVDGHFWEELRNAWKWGHWVNNANLNKALQKDADEARKSLAGMHGFTINGQAPGAIAKSGDNQQVILANRAGTNFIITQGMSICPSGTTCGVIIPPLENPVGVAAEGEAAEAAAAVAQSTGRTEAANLTEQLAMDQARANPTAGAAVPLKKGMTDARWPGSQGWVKMRQNINGVEIHYVRNVNTGAVADFKFK